MFTQHRKHKLSKKQKNKQNGTHKLILILAYAFLYHSSVPISSDFLCSAATIFLCGTFCPVRTAHTFHTGLLSTDQIKNCSANNQKKECSYDKVLHNITYFFALLFPLIINITMIEIIKNTAIAPGISPSPITGPSPVTRCITGVPIW